MNPNFRRKKWMPFSIWCFDIFRKNISFILCFKLIDVWENISAWVQISDILLCSLNILGGNWTRLVANGKTNCIVYDVTIDWVYQFVEHASKNIYVLQGIIGCLEARICFRRVETDSALPLFWELLTRLC